MSQNGWSKEESQDMSRRIYQKINQTKLREKLEQKNSQNYHQINCQIDHLNHSENKKNSANSTVELQDNVQRLLFAGNRYVKDSRNRITQYSNDYILKGGKPMTKVQSAKYINNDNVQAQRVNIINIENGTKNIEHEANPEQKINTSNCNNSLISQQKKQNNEFKQNKQQVCLIQPSSLMLNKSNIQQKQKREQKQQKQNYKGFDTVYRSNVDNATDYKNHNTYSNDYTSGNVKPSENRTIFDESVTNSQKIDIKKTFDNKY